MKNTSRVDKSWWSRHDAGQRLLVRLCAAAVCLLLARPVLAERVTAKDIKAERELLITAPEVVDSQASVYPGAWSFGGLLEAGGGDAGNEVREWLETWDKPQIVGGQLVSPRPEVFEKVVRPWQVRDGYDPASGVPWKPNLAHAPFRLLAIVNRMDLCAPIVAGSFLEVLELWRKRGQEKEFFQLTGLQAGSSGGMSGGYGGGGISGSPELTGIAFPGEGRFVFCAVDESGAPLAGGWTVIFEYNLTGLSRLEWAQAWHALGRLELKDPAYLKALEELTRRFTHGEGRSLARIRTSEGLGKGREFRQFHGFAPAALTHTPAPIFALKHSPEQRLLSDFLHDRDQLIRSGIHRLPEELPSRRSSVSFSAGSAIIPTDAPGFFWDMGSNVSREARRLFSLNTCNGCHAGETGTTTGFHIQPRAQGDAAKVSDFLRTDGRPNRVPDPDVQISAVVYREMEDRAAILAAFVDERDSAVLRALRPVLRDRLDRTH